MEEGETGGGVWVTSAGHTPLSVLEVFFTRTHTFDECFNEVKFMSS